MSKSTSVKSSAPKSSKSAKSAPAKTVEAPPVLTGAQDALNGRVGARTHAIHVALIEAYEKGASLKTAQIVARARELLTSDHASYAKLDSTAPSHLNTMRKRQFIERVDGAWRLTQLGAKTCGAKTKTKRK